MLRDIFKLRSGIRKGILKIANLDVYQVRVFERRSGIAGTLAILALVLLAAPADAQDLEPRTYTNLPMGQHFLGVGYAYSDGELNPAPGVPIENAEITVKATLAAYVKSLDLWGRAGKLDVVLPRTCFEGEAELEGELVRGDRCGAGDPAARLSYLFYGAPAQDLKTFMLTPVGFVMGGSIRVRPPWGQYNNENLINHGANRWEFRPEFGASNRWGNWSADASISAAFFTDNDRYAGRNTLEQEALYQVQAHLIYHISRGRWLALNGNYFWGGQTELNNEHRDDRQENSRIGVTLALPLNPQHSIKLYASRGVVTRIGNDSDTVGVVWQYRWGD